MSWKPQVRSYNVDKDIAKDLRTGIEHPFGLTISGDIDCFLESAIRSPMQWPLSDDTNPQPEMAA